MENHAHVVLDQHNRHLRPAMQITNEFGDSVSFLIAHARRRLVEQQETRPQGQRHGDLGDALVAVGEFAD